MPSDSRLPRVLHALLHLDQMKAPATSDVIGQMLGTNPSVVRRTMAGLRKAGLVSSTKGHGGGWLLAKSLSDITLGDVYDALGAPPLFALGPAVDAPSCLMEQAANAATARALDCAAKTFSQELAAITVADLAEDFEGRLAKLKSAPKISK